MRAKAGEHKETQGGKRYAVGYVTNAIESGHKVRRPRPVHRDGYSYRPRIKVAAVAGQHFYAQTQSAMDRLGRAELERLAQEIVRRLEGGA